MKQVNLGADHFRRFFYSRANRDHTINSGALFLVPVPICKFKLDLPVKANPIRASLAINTVRFYRRNPFILSESLFTIQQLAICLTPFRRFRAAVKFSDIFHGISMRYIDAVGPGSFDSPESWEGESSILRLELRRNFSERICGYKYRAPGCNRRRYAVLRGLLM